MTFYGVHKIGGTPVGCTKKLATRHTTTLSPYLSLREALVHESEVARNEPDSQVHHLPRAYDDGLPSSAIRLRM